MTSTVTFNVPAGSYVADDSYIPFQYIAYARHLGMTNINVVWCDGHVTSVSCPVRPDVPFDEYQRAYRGDLTSYSSGVTNYWDRF